MSEELKISSVQISNYRSIRDVVIRDLPRVLGVWGENGSGKSNLLQAIFLSIQNNSQRDIDNIISQFHIQRADILNKFIPGSKTLNIIYNRGTKKEVSKQIDQNGNVPNSNLKFEKNDVIYLPPWRHIIDKHSHLAQGSELEHLRFVSNGNITQNFIENQINQLTSRAADEDKDAKELYSIINTWSKAVGLGRISSRLDTDRTTSTYADTIDETKMDVTDAGFGGRTVLPIIALTTLTNNKIILIEEPEISLHPAAQADMAEQLVNIAIRQNHQIIFTSHSDYLLKRFIRMMKDGIIDQTTFKAMNCSRNKVRGSTYEYIPPETLLDRFEKMAPIIPEIHARKK